MDKKEQMDKLSDFNLSNSQKERLVDVINGSTGGGGGSANIETEYPIAKVGDKLVLNAGDEFVVEDDNMLHINLGSIFSVNTDGEVALKYLRPFYVTEKHLAIRAGSGINPFFDEGKLSVMAGSGITYTGPEVSSNYAFIKLDVEGLLDGNDYFSILGTISPYSITRTDLPNNHNIVGSGLMPDDEGKLTIKCGSTVYITNDGYLETNSSELRVGNGLEYSIGILDLVAGDGIVVTDYGISVNRRDWSILGNKDGISVNIDNETLKLGESTGDPIYVDTKYVGDSILVEQLRWGFKFTYSANDYSHMDIGLGDYMSYTDNKDGIKFQADNYYTNYVSTRLAKSIASTSLQHNGSYQLELAPAVAGNGLEYVNGGKLQVSTSIIKSMVGESGGGASYTFAAPLTNTNNNIGLKVNTFVTSGDDSSTEALFINSVDNSLTFNVSRLQNAIVEEIGTGITTLADAIKNYINVPTYTAGHGINIDAYNNINAATYSAGLGISFDVGTDSVININAGTGLAFGATGKIGINAGTGLAIDGSTVIVKIKEINSGLNATNDGLSVRTNIIGGLSVDANGVKAIAGNGIVVNSLGITVNYDNTSPLAINNKVLTIDNTKLANSIETMLETDAMIQMAMTTGLAAHIAAGGEELATALAGAGLVVNTSGGIDIDLGEDLEVNSNNELSIKYETNTRINILAGTHYISKWTSPYVDYFDLGNIEEWDASETASLQSGNRFACAKSGYLSNILGQTEGLFQILSIFKDGSNITNVIVAGTTAIERYKYDNTTSKFVYDKQIVDFAQ